MQIQMHSLAVLCLWVVFALQATLCYSSVVSPAQNAPAALSARENAGSSSNIQHTISSTYRSISSASLSASTNSSRTLSKATLNSTQPSNGGFSSRTELSSISTSAAGSKSSTITTREGSAPTRPSYRFNSALPSSTLSQPAQRYPSNFTGVPRLSGSGRSAVTAFTSSSPVPAAPSGCYLIEIADYGQAPYCICSDGNTYSPLTQGTTPASRFPGPCQFTATPKSTASVAPLGCVVYGPKNCSTNVNNTAPNIAGAEQRYWDEVKGNCSDTVKSTNYPGPNAVKNGDTCAHVFNVTEYLSWWWPANEASCNQYQQIGLANCFYDYVGGHNSSNCSTVSVDNTKCPQLELASFSGPNATLEYYVAWNINNFAQWITAYYSTMYNAIEVAGDFVWPMSLHFEHLSGAPIAATIIAAVFSFALGLISPSGWAAVGPEAVATASTRFLPFAIEVPGEYVLRAFQQAPAFGDKLTPDGTLDDAFIDAGDMEGSLGSWANVFKDVIENAGVNDTMNHTTFNHWLSSGYFYNAPPDQPTMQTGLVQALNTYVLSQVLQNYNIIIARQVDTNPFELQFNATGKGLGVHLGCDGGYNNWSMCGQWWWDSTSNTAYSLYKEDDYWANYIPDLTWIFDGGYTTPENLFLGSQLCALEANSTRGTDPRDVLDSLLVGGFQTPCLSNIRVCTWNLQSAWPEFSEEGCPQNQNYDLDDCVYDETGVPDSAPLVDPPLNENNVPFGYLGYMLYHGAACEVESR